MPEEGQPKLSSAYTHMCVHTDMYKHKWMASQKVESGGSHREPVRVVQTPPSAEVQSEDK